MSTLRNYGLVTAAHNEEVFIERTIQSVVAQSLLPAMWVIVSDSSTDRTEEIVERYAREFGFIRLMRLREPHGRSFKAQVNAINAGIVALKDTSYDYIGNIDADISFGPTYFEALMERLETDAKLGLVGGWIVEGIGEGIGALPGDETRSVPHAVQFFRRECFEEIGRYRPLPYGGPDTYAEVSARMKGWRVASFPDLVVDHHRAAASSGGLLRGRFRQGLMDYSLGYHPAFESIKCLRRMAERPRIIGGTMRLAGFLFGAVAIRHAAASKEFVEFLRKEQIKRILELLPRPRT